MSTKTSEPTGSAEKIQATFSWMREDDGEYSGLCAVAGTFLRIGEERFASEEDAAMDAGMRHARVKLLLNRGAQLLVVLRAADGKEMVLAGGELEAEGATAGDGGDAA